MKLSTPRATLIHTIFRDLLLAFLLALVWDEVFQPIESVVASLAILTIAFGLIATLAEPPEAPPTRAPSAPTIELGVFIAVLVLGGYAVWRLLAPLGNIGAVFTALAVLLTAGLYLATRRDLLTLSSIGDLTLNKTAAVVAVLTLLAATLVLWLAFGVVAAQALWGGLYIFGVNGLLWSYILFTSGKLIGPMRIALAFLIGLGLFPVLVVIASRLGMPVTAASLLLLNTVFCVIPLVMLRLGVSRP